MIYWRMRTKLQPLFIDLDETLIYAREAPADGSASFQGSKRVLAYEAIMRPEAPEMLGICREGGRQVFLFTNAFFGFALEASQTFPLGFTETTIFSLAMILNCRRGLSPRSALIDNKPPTAEPTREKMDALGISSAQVWVIPAFEPPRFPPAKLFLLGLPLRLARLDRWADSTRNR
jgi:hypothetical protein